MIWMPVQSDPVTMDIPVIFLTGANDSESVMEVLKLKPAGYVLKSTSLKDIFDMIYNFFRKQEEDEDDIFAF